MQSPTSTITADRFDAVLFDLDGVVTATAKVHALSWKKTFDELLRKRAADRPPRLFELPEDYQRYVDGKPRYQGVSSFLRSRGIDLPWGEPDATAGLDTVCALGNLKNAVFKATLAQQGVEPFTDAVALTEELRRAGIKTAVVTSSRNARAVLDAGGISGLFDLLLDGETADREKLAGKPAPDTYLAAARLLGVDRGRAVVIEDALAGVQAARNGGFGMVVGVDRGARGHAQALVKNGADIVVADLRALLSATRHQPPR